MRRATGAGVVSLILLALFMLVTTRASNTHADPQGQFSFTIPDGFDETDFGPYLSALKTFVAPSPQNALFAVGADTSRYSADMAGMDQYLITVRDELALYGDAGVGTDSLQSLVLGGLPARKLDFFEMNHGIRYHDAVVVTIRGTTLFSLIFRAESTLYDALISQTQIVLTSFMFSGDPNANRAPFPTFSHATDTPKPAPRTTAAPTSTSATTILCRETGSATVPCSTSSVMRTPTPSDVIRRLGDG